MSLYSVKVSLKLRAGVAQRPIFAFLQQLYFHSKELATKYHLTC